MIARFLLFTCYQYYPGGGWNDFAGSFRTLEEAVEAAAKETSKDWWHVVDGDTGKIVKYS